MAATGHFLQRCSFATATLDVAPARGAGADVVDMLQVTSVR
jgi:hypothetical protein